MTRKSRRLITIATVMATLSCAAALSLWAMSDNLVFFVTPSELAAKAGNGHQVRMGGLVETGSIVKSPDQPATVRFKVTDGKASQLVVYRGTLPDLFREGQGVIVEGAEQPDGVFKATEVLAKHDEKYMPKDVADKLKASGEWRPDAGAAPLTPQRTAPGA